MTLKLNFVKGRGYENYITKDVKKEHKEEAKTNEDTEEEQEAPVVLGTQLQKVFHSVFLQFRGVRQYSAKLQFKWTLSAQILQFQKLQRSQF